MACYFIVICMPYDVLYIIWVLNDNTKKSTVHAPVWPLDVCCETSILSTFVLADTDKIEYRLRQVVNLPWTGVQPRGSLMTFIQLALRKPEIKQRLSLVGERMKIFTQIRSTILKTSSQNMKWFGCALIPLNRQKVSFVLNIIHL